MVHRCDRKKKKKFYLPYGAPPSDSEPEAEVKSKPRHVHTNTEWFLYTVGVDYFIHFHWTETGSCFCSTFITVWFCFQFSSHSIYLTNKSYVFNPRWWITDFTEPLLPSFFFKAAVPLPPPSPFLPPSVPLCPWWKPTVTCWYLPSSSWHTFIPAVSHRDTELCVCVCMWGEGGRRYMIPAQTSLRQRCYRNKQGGRRVRDESSERKKTGWGQMRRERWWRNK